MLIKPLQELMHLKYEPDTRDTATSEVRVESVVRATPQESRSRPFRVAGAPRKTDSVQSENSVGPTVVQRVSSKSVTSMWAMRAGGLER